MLKVNIFMKDGTELKKVLLFRDKEERDSELKNKSEIYEALRKGSGRVHFLGEGVWGELFVNQIVRYETLDEAENFESRIKNFVDSTSNIYDLTDIAEWIINNKEELRVLLQ